MKHRMIVLYFQGKIFGEPEEIEENEWPIYRDYYKKTKLELRTISRKKADKISYWIDNHSNYQNKVRGLEEFYPAGLDPKEDRRRDAKPPEVEDDFVDNYEYEDYNLIAG